MDTGDKSTNKAMSMAMKYAAILTFCIPTGGEDADAGTHEVRGNGKTESKENGNRTSGPSPKPAGTPAGEGDPKKASSDPAAPPVKRPLTKVVQIDGRRLRTAGIEAEHYFAEGNEIEPRARGVLDLHPLFPRSLEPRPAPLRRSGSLGSTTAGATFLSGRHPRDSTAIPRSNPARDGGRAAPPGAVRRPNPGIYAARAASASGVGRLTSAGRVQLRRRRGRSVAAPRLRPSHDRRVPGAARAERGGDGGSPAWQSHVGSSDGAAAAMCPGRHPGARGS